MPTLAESYEKLGISIPEGVSEEVLFEAAKGSDSFTGLVNKNTELLAWKAENKPVLENLAAEREALATKAKEEEAKALQLAQENGDFKTAAEITAKRLKDLEDGLNASREKTRASTHESAIQGIASLFDDSVFGNDVAATKAFTSLNDAGEPVTTYKLGSDEFDKQEDLIAAMAKIPSYANHMKVGGENRDTGASGANGGYGGGNIQPKFNGNKSERVAAAVKANPKLSELPER